MSYFHKYRKYKNKYQILKQQLEQKLLFDNFYFLHFTTRNNLLDILSDGIILPGKNVPVSKRTLRKNPLDNIYALIYFNDLKNISIMPSYALIINPNIILDYTTKFYKGWGTIPNPIIIYPNDSLTTIKHKIAEIKNFIANPIDLPPILQSSEIMTHEVLFDKPIPLDKYLLGIICKNCNENKIRNIIKNTEYANVPIYT